MFYCVVGKHTETYKHSEYPRLPNTFRQKMVLANTSKPSWCSHMYTNIYLCVRQTFLREYLWKNVCQIYHTEMCLPYLSLNCAVFFAVECWFVSTFTGTSHGGNKHSQSGKWKIRQCGHVWIFARPSSRSENTTF